MSELLTLRETHDNVLWRLIDAPVPHDEVHEQRGLKGHQQDHKAGNEIGRRVHRLQQIRINETRVEVWVCPHHLEEVAVVPIQIWVSLDILFVDVSVMFDALELAGFNEIVSQELIDFTAGCGVEASHGPVLVHWFWVAQDGVTPGLDLFRAGPVFHFLLMCLNNFGCFLMV